MFKRPYRKIIYRKKVKILTVQIANRNLGDQIIADNAAYLVRQALPRLTGKHYVLQPYDIQSGDDALVQEADLIIFDGGGLVKYRQEDFHIHVPAILECAQEYGIPVYVNCVGVEGYDAGDERCLRLAQALNYDCVKGITVRDDLETLRRDYLCGTKKMAARGGFKTLRRDGLHADQVFTAPAVDPAVFTPETYGIKKDASAKAIGLGIVRSRIFEDYGMAEVTPAFQLKMWQGIIEELEARGYRWKLFVNGLRSDYDFALEVLEHLGRSTEAPTLLAPRPLDGRQLTGLVASFAGVIACRMHANIVAYALGIASIGLVWNDKMVFWGERIGYSERFLKTDQFKPAYIVQCLLDAMACGVRPCPDALKKSVQKPLQKFVRHYGAAAWKKNRANHLKKPQPWADRLVACALGGIQMRYTNMNTMAGLTHALAQGFHLFEADIRLTKDGRLVCVNGWSKGSYEKLGVDPEEYTNGMDYNTFMQCRMYGSFATMDATQLFAQMRTQAGDGWKLILDIGKPDKETLGVMIEELRGLFGDSMDWEAHVFLRLQGKYDVEAVQQAWLPVQVMYYVPPKQVREEKGITLESIGKYCKKRQIQWVSMPKEALDGEVMETLRKQKLKSCVFTYNRYTDVTEALRLGVTWIATSYLSVAELEGWYEPGYTVVIR